VSNVIVLYADTCPFKERQQSITIKLAEIRICGQSKPSYKKLSYDCDYTDECPYVAQDKYGRCPYVAQDKYGRCPLFLKAPSEPK
jgi:hypothetical protein